MKIDRFDIFLNKDIAVVKKVNGRHFFWEGLLREVNYDDNTIVIYSSRHGTTMLEVTDILEVKERRI